MYAHYALGVLFMDYLDDRHKALWHLEEYAALGGDDARVAAWIERLK